VALVCGLILAVSGCGDAASPAASPPAPVARRSATPSAPDKARPLTPAEAAATIRSTVTQASPVLLPTAVPAGWTAVVATTPSTFMVTYIAPNGVDANLRLQLAVTNPEPPGPHGSQRSPRFRGDAQSLYQVDDATMPESARYVIWTEPGHWPGQRSGVPYLLSAVGVLEADFWRMAESLSAG
jgi:hypothetical protein